LFDCRLACFAVTNALPVFFSVALYLVGCCLSFFGCFLLVATAAKHFAKAAAADLLAAAVVAE
jgi:hypothetical protein